MTTLADHDARQAARRASPLLAATGISVTGDQAFVVAAAVLASELTHDPVVVSWVFAAFGLTWILFGLPAGALISRLPLRRVLVAADLIRAGLLALLAGLVLAGYASVPLIVGFMVAAGIAQTFNDPAAQAIIPAVVGDDKEALERVNSRFWTLDRIGRFFVGPPLGSSLLALARPLPFLADSVSFLGSAALVRRLPHVAARDGEREPVRAAIGQGLRYVRTNTNLLIVVASSGAWNFGFAAGWAVFVLYAREVLRVPPFACGLLIVPASACGALASWKLAPVLNRRLSARRIVAAGALVQAAVWPLPVMVHQTWAAIAALVMIDIVASPATVAIVTTYQRVPEDMRTRVASASRALTWGGAAAGSLAGGAVAGGFGLTSAFILASGISAVTAVAAWPRHGRAVLPDARPARIE